MVIVTCSTFLKSLYKNFLRLNILKFFLAISSTFFVSSVFSQENSSDVMYLNMIKAHRNENQTQASLSSKISSEGFRVKSSTYSNALINQSNFKGYNLVRSTLSNSEIKKEKEFKTDKDKIIYSEDYTSFDKNTSKLILTNTIAAMEYQVKEVISIKKKDIPYIAAVAGITVGLIALDAKLDDLVKNALGKNKKFDEVTDFITDFGAENSLYTVGIWAGLSVVTNSHKGVQTSLYAFESMLSSGLWIRAGKLLAGRERPEASYEYSKHRGGMWRGPINQLINKEKRSVASYDAFPSGHTATIFSVATVFAEQYKDIKVVPVFCYSFATIVGISRMYEHAHWASDVFLGAVIGYLCGQATLDFYKKNERYNDKKVKFAFRPSITPLNYGADMTMNF